MLRFLVIRRLCLAMLSLCLVVCLEVNCMEHLAYNNMRTSHNTCFDEHAASDGDGTGGGEGRVHKRAVLELLVRERGTRVRVTI
jgi:hypothetical protein